MGNKQNTGENYRTIPTQSYINYVVRKHKDVWERNIQDEQGSEIEKVEKPHKPPRKPGFYSKFCCCFYSNVGEEDEVYIFFHLSLFDTQILHNKSHLFFINQN